MNVKTLAILVVVAAVAIAATVWKNRAPQGGITTEKALLLPGLDEGINEVTVLRIKKAGAEGTEIMAELKRTEQGWVVANKYEYPADVGAVRATLLVLAEAELIEEKTADPDLYERLGVQDLDKAEAPGTGIEIEGLDQPLALIIGNNAAGVSKGAYVRRAGEDKSWLAGGEFSVSREQKQWLVRELLDIPSERIQQIKILHPDGETLTLRREAREQADFAVVDPPAGRAPVTDGTPGIMGAALAALTLDDVLPVAELNPAEQDSIVAEYRTFDGLVIKVDTFATAAHRYVHFEVAFDEEQARRFAPAAPKSEGGESVEQTAEEKTAGVDEAEIAAREEEAERLQQRLGGWVYVIPSYKQEHMAKRMEDLLAPVEGAEESADEGSPAPSDSADAP